MKKFWLLILIAALIQACGNNDVKDDKKVSEKDTLAKKEISNDYMILSVLYYQKAAETRALYYQAFNTAKLMLDNDLKVKTKEKKAIVLDIDETALDNSPFEAQCILGKFGYPEKWDEWCNQAKAEPTPGAIEFLKYAAEKGCTLFYITNRKEKLKEGTLKNLVEKGFPMADQEHVLFRTEGNSKEDRRQQVLKSFNIVLLIGDNLADFTSVYDAKLDIAQRAAKTDSLKIEFGKKFIVLPNPMYGDWEMLIYPDPAASPEVKDSIRKANLTGF
jgi:5'-nucleotidase (lipoprotein e(P4) family)